MLNQLESDFFYVVFDRLMIAEAELWMPLIFYVNYFAFSQSSARWHVAQSDLRSARGNEFVMNLSEANYTQCSCWPLPLIISSFS
jgi:hypothetical protein